MSRRCTSIRRASRLTRRRRRGCRAGEDAYVIRIALRLSRMAIFSRRDMYKVQSTLPRMYNAIALPEPMQSIREMRSNVLRLLEVLAGASETRPAPQESRSEGVFSEGRGDRCSGTLKKPPDPDRPQQPEEARELYADPDQDGKNGRNAFLHRIEIPR